MIKAIHLRSSFDPGGTETLLLNLFNFKQHKIQFFFALIKEGQYVDKLSSEKNVYLKLYRKTRLDISVITNLSRLIRREKISLIHTHQEIELFYAAILKLVYPGIRIFHHIHLYNPKKNWEYFLERLLIKFTHHTFVVSSFLNGMLIKKGYDSAKLKVLYNAVKKNDEGLPFKQNLEQFKKRINHRSSDFIIGMVGNFVPEKDQLTMVKAYQLYLRAKFPQLKIVFIGKESKLTRDCHRFLNDSDIDHQVFFLGSMEYASQYLNILDLFVMSSKNETFNIAIIEALLSKIPVLASDIEVFRELSFNKRYFQLFKAGDAEDLAKNITRFINNDSDVLNQHKIDLAYQYALENFSYKKYIEQLAQYYNN